MTQNSPTDILNRLRPYVKPASEQPSYGDKSSEPCHCGGSRGYYFKKEDRKWKFEICSICDARSFCVFCHATGLRPNEPDPHRPHSRRMICPCLDPSTTARYLNEASIPQRYLRLEPENIEVQHLNKEQRETLKKNMESVDKFCDKVKRFFHDEDITFKPFILFYGPVGTGKTLLASCILKRLIKENIVPGLFLDFQTLLSTIKEEYDQKRSGETLMRTACEVDLLLIDEFGKGRFKSDWPLEKLDFIINTRYNNNKITILTTNYLPEGKSYTSKDAKQMGRQKETKNDLHLTDADFFKEGFLEESLKDRIGARMHDRIMEESLILDFRGLSNYRERMADDLATRI